MARMKHAWLTVPGQRMPHPLDASREFPAEGQSVDVESPVWMHLLADGSLTLDDPTPVDPGTADAGFAVPETHEPNDAAVSRKPRRQT